MPSFLSSARAQGCQGHQELGCDSYRGGFESLKPNLEETGTFKKEHTMGEKSRSREDCSGHACCHRSRLDCWKGHQQHTHGVGTHECWGDLSNSPFVWVSHSFLGNIGKLRPPGQERALWPGSQGEGSCSHSGEGTASERDWMATVSLVPFGRGWKLQPLIV